MGTTTGFKRNPDAEILASVLGQLARLQELNHEVAFAIQRAIEAPQKAMYQVSVSSNRRGRHARARGRTLQNALATAFRRYRAIYQVRVHMKDKVNVSARFPAGISVKIPRKLWRSYATNAIKRITIR